MKKIRECQRTLNIRDINFFKIFIAGTNHGQRNIRLWESVASQGENLGTIRTVIKTHKPWDGKSRMKTRPMVGGVECLTTWETY